MTSAKWIEEQLKSSSEMYHELPKWIREIGSAQETEAKKQLKRNGEIKKDIKVGG